MDLGLPPVDPEKALKAFENIKNAFLEAASAETSAQPLFQSLSDKFNKMVEDVMEMAATDSNPSPSKIMFKMMPVIMDVQRTASQIAQLAQTDEKVAETLQTLSDTIKGEISNIMPAGGLGGFGIPGFPGSQPGGLDGDDLPPPSKPNIHPKKPGPKKPGKPGNFDL